jgi:iron complex outermembrane receptor protein
VKNKKTGVAAVAGLALSALGSAHAQQAAERLERIEITGSRLPAASDSDSTSPVAIVSAEDLRVEGFQSLELILNNYPQFQADQGTRISNAATGTATANLRALGANRTLVLFNGRRMVAGNPYVLVPDLNQVPPALIRRVEILTGGASAIYGSDAIAGVVNFIIEDRFEGVRGDLAWDFYNHQQQSAFAQDLLRQGNLAIPADKSMDGESGSASLTVGGNFPDSKGNAVASLRYFKSQALRQSERDYSACSIGSVGPPDNRMPACVGSSAGNPGLFIDLGFFEADPALDPRRVQRLTLDRTTGAVRNFMNALDGYNFAPLNYYQRPQERYGFDGFANYDLTPEARVYAELGFHDDRTVAQIAPTAVFFLPVQVRYENPLLNADWRSRLLFRHPDGTVGTGPGTTANVQISRRNIDGSARQDDLHHTSSRGVIGLKGVASGRWDYDLFFQSSRVRYEQTYLHDWSDPRIRRALDIVADPVTGAAVCASVLNGTDPRCVPLNVWSLDAITPEASAYTEVPASSSALTSLQVIGGTVSGNLGDYGVQLPGARAPVEIALGFERRTEKLDFTADAEFESLAGQGQPIRPVNGRFTVNEVFGELRIPVLDALDVNGSYRYSDYDTGVKTNTFGLGFIARLSTSLRARGSWQRAVRAPNLQELFSPQFSSGYGLLEGDPCAGEAPARSLADCQRTGVRADRYGQIVPHPEGQDGTYPATVGGNPGLEPETANTYTLGVVLNPTQDFGATIDYFDIRIDDTIASIDGSVILEQCLDTGSPFFCGLVKRDTVSSALWYGDANVVAINRNIGKARVAGADVAFTWRLRLGEWGSLAFDGLGTYLHKQSIEAYKDAPTAECAGYFASDCAGPPLPKWRHRLRATWKPSQGFEAAATWRYIHSTDVNPQVEQDFLVSAAMASIPSVSYLDLAGSWNITKQLTLRGGVNNVLDRDPPLSLGPAPVGNGNTFAQVYDSLGRHFFVALTAKF